MGRLIAIDFGKKRCGLAATDSMKIVANSLATVGTPELENYLRDYFAREEVELVVVGLPRNLDGEASESQRYLLPALGRLRKAFPGMRFEMYDERFTSVLAHRAMLEGGASRSQRRRKDPIDRMSACIILNDFLQSRAWQELRAAGPDCKND